MTRPKTNAPHELENGARLPHPIRLFRRLTGCDHYHFGLFPSSPEASSGEEHADRLRDAMDRMAVSCVERLAPGSRVLDVGCGMGGTAVQLAEWGFEVMALDPARELIAFARERPGKFPGSPRPEFYEGRLEDLELSAAFELVLSIEALQHFGRLAAFFGAARAVLAPAGRLSVFDLTLHGVPSSPARPFHSKDALLETAEAHGFELEGDIDLTARVRPTLELLGSRLTEERATLLTQNGDWHAAHGEDVEALGNQLHLLAAAFDEGFLAYHQLDWRACRTPPR